MGWRFRRSVKIAPGVRWNFGTRGSSWSIEPRGFKLNFSNRGTRRTVSIPGTGISHSEMLSGPDRPDPGRHRFASPSPPAEPESSRVRVYGTLTDQTASEAVASWARREFPILGRMLPSVVTSLKRDTVERTDVQYTITRRQVVVRAEPLPRKVKPQGPAPNPSDFDAWTDVEKVLQLDPTIAVCPVCNGEASRQCQECNGTVEFTCDICAGAGQIISERSGKLVKCRSCGGDGLKTVSVPRRVPPMFWVRGEGRGEGSACRGRRSAFRGLCLGRRGVSASRPVEYLARQREDHARVDGHAHRGAFASSESSSRLPAEPCDTELTR
jgi:uncharacterized protein DUF4236